MKAHSHGLLALLLIAPSIAQVYAGDQGGKISDVDKKEHRMELSYHERLTVIKNNPQNSLAVFTTDGCSGGLSKGWELVAGKIESFKSTYGESPPWESCCIAHDRHYHTAGARQSTVIESFNARKDADQELRQCVYETGNDRATELAQQYDLSVDEVQKLYKFVADLMYRAVRLGGIPCSGLSWRWGYGWPPCH